MHTIWTVGAERHGVAVRGDGAVGASGVCVRLRPAACPMRTCGTSCTEVHTSVATGFPDSAAQVGAPTNSSAAAVGTTVTRALESAVDGDGTITIRTARPAGDVVASAA